MSILEPYADESQSATERLLENSWEARERRASQRELVVEASAAGLFVAAAGRPGLTGGMAGLRPQVAVLLMAVYAVVGRIEFPVGAGLRGADTADPRADAADAAAGGRAGRGRRSGWSAATPWNARSAGCRRAGSCPRSPMPGTRSARRGPARGGIAAHRLRSAAAAGGGVRRRVHRRPGGLDGADAPGRRRPRPQAADAGDRAGVGGRRLRWRRWAFWPPWPRARATRRSCSSCRWCSCCGCWPATAASASTRPTTASSSSSSERARLQTAVRRLGDAFAAKLELSGLLEILLQRLGGGAGRRGRAPRAATARRRWSSTPGMPLAGSAGARDGRRAVRGPGPGRRARAAWMLGVPMRIAASPRAITGELRFARADRAVRGRTRSR